MAIGVPKIVISCIFIISIIFSLFIFKTVFPLYKSNRKTITVPIKEAIAAPLTPNFKPYINIGSKIIFTTIPIALILIRFFDVNGIWLAISISSILKGVISYLIYKLRIWKEYKDVKCDQIT